ncbi:zinc-binding dehydrogenase [Xanthocytophaga agilis]|uniref:Zinc-binding dehydrogenase n=1 Tax=Xanthocytophaga agilis TaxID=3048010 RepID=A0AAE3RCA8_9BACT|nr:zinc-binding dehydrogenase [Xanthocytophaga agilis]MDJ1505735.1 zinc-binding dehydrogenase [Xanthocytophaga agilis]
MIQNPYDLSGLKNKKVIIRTPGPAEVCEIFEEDLPSLNAAQVLVKVEYCGVALGDILFREGISPVEYPMTPGYDVVGHIVAIGTKVYGFKPGDRVAALTLKDGYSSYVCIDSEIIVAVPQGITSEKAIGAMLNYVTAYQLLVNKAKLPAGSSILIHGAAGGVGLAVLGLAKVLNITAYGTVSTHKVSTVTVAGGIPIDYTQTDFVKEILIKNGKGVDAVFDPIGGSNLWRSYKVLDKNGQLISFGVGEALKKEGNAKWRLFKAVWPLIVLKLLPNSRKVRLYTTSPKNRHLKEVIERVFAFVELGKITPVISKVFPLTSVIDAHKYLTDQRPMGKVLLKP